VPALLVWAAALLLIGLSFQSYAGHFRTDERWQAETYDPADYRYVAERFWGVRYRPETYWDSFNQQWRTLLDQVPFRGIGLGTLYLLAGQASVGHAPATPPEILAAGVVLTRTEKMLLALSSLLMFVVVWRRWGSLVGLASLAVLLWPTHIWRVSDDFEAEPAERVLFLLALALCLWAWPSPRSRRADAPHRHRLAIAGLCAVGLLVTLLKVQWYVLPFLMLPAWLLQGRTLRLRAGALLTACAGAVLIPATVLAVNGLGWQTYRLNAGIGLHINLKHGGRVLREFSADPRHRPNPLADTSRPRYPWWDIYVGPDTTRDDYAEFDRFALADEQQHLRETIGDFAEGLWLATTIPGVERLERGLIRFEPLSPPWSSLIRVADVAVWLLLIWGWLLPPTRLASALCVGLWVVPALGHMVSLYEPRYPEPMAGLGAVVALGVVAEVWQGRRRRDGQP